MGFVSRAGGKLEHALVTFGISVEGKVCADLGSCTGGFVDCLLKYGAKKVYAVDTAYGELDWGLRNDNRVVVMERTNALHVILPEKVDFLSVDVGWTPQAQILPHIFELVHPEGDIVSLLKPQYETDLEISDSDDLSEVEAWTQSLLSMIEEKKGESLYLKGVDKSPVLGRRKGTVEYLLWLKPSRK